MQLKQDPEGFLVELDDWSESVAIAIAAQDDIVLSDDHWRVVFAVRDFFEHFESSPSMRQLVRFLKSDHADIASSVALLKLFPGSPAKYAAKIAGLPKPENCL